MNVYLNLTYKDGTTQQKRVRQTPNWETLNKIIEHYRSMPNVESVCLDVS